ncbi:hypothetical protein PHYBLDRAFT_69695 [Phycomyces blakesleeanus NRRL 1555(-)]|uniref:SEC7 domain-containing protein n=1 Tax=Phycomyces blakesleeanus (strain ATCC 8743b / DSM 1359 / FGSC 10004 / NBRC 33097 / NRRL 1555) TaxID=763407 RepID=A0A167PQG1_PHYB8|nr:hypothetical protein PHYBLDRAFT_69695 [Phycomyces blakesleeanus NRRL 1555(-)]OAD78356.1 hypothetical protein PHYBLDRAFT_69695 [Phycomyces blakesleeanus NRRL 1555(-)]|eukprot:XP_018296396.1 hypothetical protein PHYBLDRAFT_69695 [Phycomyces blakesleeanus NRRL 1555(-)]
MTSSTSAVGTESIQSDLMNNTPESSHPNTFAEQLESFDFRGDAIDTALRKLLAKVHLPKESQQIDRAMEDFGKRYQTCNPGLTDNPDGIYAVAFSLLMLHTDAHNKNVRQKMNKETFIIRTRLLDGGENLPAEILDVLYDNIVSTEFVFTDAEPELYTASKSTSWFSKLSKSESSTSLSASLVADLYPKLDLVMPAENTFSFKRTLKPINIMDIHLSLMRALPLCLGGVRTRSNPGSGTSTYTVRVTKAGILDRKNDLNQHGKKASARSWRPVGVMLCGSQLLFFAEISSFQSWMDSVEDEQRSTVYSGGGGNGNGTDGDSGGDEQQLMTSTRPRNTSLPVPLVNQPRPPFTPPSPSTSIPLIQHPPPSLYSSTSLVSTSTLHPQQQQPPFSPTGQSMLQPYQIYSLAEAVCVYDESYVKYPHVFRLITGDGQQFLLRAEDDADLEDWMLKINYAAAIKTTGTRLRQWRYPSDQRPVDRREQRKLVERAKREEKAALAISNLSDDIVNHVKALDQDLQLRRNLMVLIPLQKSTKDRILALAELVGKRIREKRIELQRLECYRSFIEKELSWCSSEVVHRKMSAPHVHTHYLAQRSSTVPILVKDSPSQRQQENEHKQEMLSVHQIDDNRNSIGGPGFVPKRTSSLLKLSALATSEIDISNRSESPVQILARSDDDDDDDDYNNKNSNGNSNDSCRRINGHYLQSDDTLEFGHDNTRTDSTDALLLPPSDESVAWTSDGKAKQRVTELDRLMRRRSRSHPIMPNSRLIGQAMAGGKPRPLLDVPLVNTRLANRERSSSEVSSVQDDDDVSVIVINNNDTEESPTDEQLWSTPA